jgi:ABC-type amino acid transport substrate-binding protein
MPHFRWSARATASVALCAAMCAATCAVAGCDAGTGNAGASANAGTTPNAGTGGSSAAYQLVQPGTLTVAITPGGLPFNTIGSTGQPSGMLAALNDDIARRLGLRVTYEATTLSGALEGLSANRYDVVSIGIIETTAREKSLTLTKPVWWGTHADVLERTDDASANLAGKRVGVNTGSIEASFAKHSLAGAQIVSEPSLTAGVDELLSGSLDGFVIGDTQARSIVARYPATLKIGLTGPQNTPIVEALNPAEKGFQEAYDRQLAELAANGTLLKLIEQYIDVTAGQVPAQLLRYWPGLLSAAR